MRKPKAVQHLPEARDAKEARMYIFAGMFWFLWNQPKRTLAIAALIFSPMVYVAQDYWGSDRASIKELKPLSEQSSLMPQAFAQGTRNQIIVNGKSFGEYDTNYELWKLKSEPMIVVHYKPTGKVFGVEMQSIDKAAK